MKISIISEVGLTICIVLEVIAFVNGVVPPAARFQDEAINRFKVFSIESILKGNLAEISTSQGATVSNPFSVGYMLANIQDQIKNVSSYGFDTVFKTDKTTADYANLLEALNKAKVTTKSVHYVRNKQTSPVELSSLSQGGSSVLKTEIKFLDFISKAQKSWTEMNDLISKETQGKLNDKLVPKGNILGGGFWPFTLSTFINTIHFKSNWQNKWSRIGHKEFSDGQSLPFSQIDGKFRLREYQNYTAVAIPLTDEGKHLVFVLPKSDNWNQFVEDLLPEILSNSNPASWEMSKETKIVQVPAVQLTLYEQHYRVFEARGVNRTFCIDYDRELSSKPAPSNGTGRGPYFMTPVAQAHYIEFSPDFIEIASASGSTVNSEALRQEYGRRKRRSTSNNSGVVDSLPSAKEPKANISAVKSSDNFIELNKPFVWYLHDAKLGPLYFGSIYSLAEYKQEEDAASQEENSWLVDVKKVGIWNCP